MRLAKQLKREQNQPPPLQPEEQQGKEQESAFSSISILIDTVDQENDL
jgi:hypothetical protein